MSPPDGERAPGCQPGDAATNTDTAAFHSHGYGDDSEGAFPVRGYQRDAIDAIESAWARGATRVGAVIATGGGKTVVFSHVIRRLPGRVLVLAHREELIEQAAGKIRAICAGRSVGVVRAEHDDVGADIVIASVATLAREERRRRIGGVDLVVVDECHHAAAATYRDVLEHFGCFSGTRALGVTATMGRGDGQPLGDIWETVAYELDILDLVEAGHLCDVRGISVELEGLDLDGVGRAGGDYQVGALAERMDAADAWAIAAAAYQQHAAERRGIAFTPNVESAYVLAEHLSALGISAEAVDGTTPKDERRAILNRFRSGDTQVVTNCGVLTEGYDAPWASAVLIARPTSSAGLFVQMAGRGLRPHENKVDALLIDVVGTTRRHRLACLADLTGRDVGTIPSGESLAEARARKATESRTLNRYLGELTVEEIELFDRDRGVVWPEWHGVRFVDIPRHKTTLYLAPSADGYDVVIRDRRDPARDEKTLHSSLPFRIALRRAEAHAAQWGAQLVRRDAPWRRRPASTQQREALRRMRIASTGDITAGDASLAITTALVAEDFDRKPPRGYIDIPEQRRRDKRTVVRA